MDIAKEDLAWSRAYAVQAISDLRAMDALGESSVDRCHWLHYLQMAAEKVCKAYLSLGGHEQVRKRHDYTRGTLPVIARSILSSEGLKNPQTSWQINALKSVAREIDLLAPASHDSLTREDNCEYPWMDASGKIHTPSTHTFTGLQDSRMLTRTVRILRMAAERYAR